MCTKNSYTLIDQLKKVENTEDWSPFMQRMAQYIISQPSLSQLANQQIDELHSEIGICPCGHGFVLDSLQDVESFYYPTHAEPMILCTKCKQEFIAQDYEYKNITMADEQDRTIKMINIKNHDLSFNTIIYPIVLWKLISVNGIIN